MQKEIKIKYGSFSIYYTHEVVTRIFILGIKTNSLMIQPTAFVQCNLRNRYDLFKVNKYFFSWKPPPPSVSDFYGEKRLSEHPWRMRVKSKWNRILNVLKKISRIPAA